jgi:hypothetical protein
MTGRERLIEWLNTLPEGSAISIDDGGLCLVCDQDPVAYYEVGGVPEIEEAECSKCDDRSCLWCAEEDIIHGLP